VLPSVVRRVELWAGVVVVVNGWADVDEWGVGMGVFGCGW